MSKLVFRSAAATVLIAGSAVIGGGVAGGQDTETMSFGYTGEADSFAVPADVCSIEVDAFGASGNDEEGGTQTPLGFAVSGDESDIAAGGLGGRATATIAVTPGATLVVNVGGQGGGSAESSMGGFNGGADGGGIDNSEAGGGGGASDVRAAGGTLADRLVVAGGGGGGGAEGDGVGGDGGGTSGDDGADSGDGSSGGGGGTQTAGGAGGPEDASAGDGELGLGGVGGDGDFENDGGGGGGGGHYGGGGGAGDTEENESDDGGGGGGGSGFGPTGVTFETGVNEGDGSVTLTWTVDPGCGEETTTTTPATQAAAVRPTFTG